MTERMGLNKQIRWHLHFTFDVVWFTVRAVFICIFALFRRLCPRQGKCIKDQTVLITGTARGLGRLLAVEFARQGCRVLCVDVNVEGNAETLKLLNSNKCQAYTCDLSNPDAVQQLAVEVTKNIGHVDILINNAGIIPPVSFREGTSDDIRKTIDINLLTHFWMIREFLPLMLQRDSGHIVAISSCAGLSALEYAGVYCATKFAVVGLMSAIEEELRVEGKTNIKFTTSCPYFFEFNEGKCHHIQLRVPAMNPSYVAKDIVHGVRQELSLFTVHRFFELLLGVIRLCPDTVQHMFRDVFYCKHDLNLIRKMTENRYNPAKLKEMALNNNTAVEINNKKEDEIQLNLANT